MTMYHQGTFYHDWSTSDNTPCPIKELYAVRGHKYVQQCRVYADDDGYIRDVFIMILTPHMPRAHTTCRTLQTIVCSSTHVVYRYIVDNTDAFHTVYMAGIHCEGGVVPTWDTVRRHAKVHPLYTGCTAATPRRMQCACRPEELTVELEEDTLVHTPNKHHIHPFNKASGPLLWSSHH